MGVGRASGDTRAVDAARQAISSNLLDVAIDGAKGVLFTITGHDYTIFEVNEAAQIIQEAADPDAQIIFGAVLNEEMQTELQITVIATGFDGRSSVRQRAAQMHQQSPGAPGEPGEQAPDPRGARPQQADRTDIPTFLRNRRP